MLPLLVLWLSLRASIGGWRTHVFAVSGSQWKSGGVGVSRVTMVLSLVLALVGWHPPTKAQVLVFAMSALIFELETVLLATGGRGCRPEGMRLCSVALMSTVGAMLDGFGLRDVVEVDVSLDEMGLGV